MGKGCRGFFVRPLAKHASSPFGPVRLERGGDSRGRIRWRSLRVSPTKSRKPRSDTPRGRGAGRATPSPKMYRGLMKNRAAPVARGMPEAWPRESSRLRIWGSVLPQDEMSGTTPPRIARRSATAPWSKNSAVGGREPVLVCDAGWTETRNDGYGESDLALRAAETGG